MRELWRFQASPVDRPPHSPEASAGTSVWLWSVAAQRNEAQRNARERKKESTEEFRIEVAERCCGVSVSIKTCTVLYVALSACGRTV